MMENITRVFQISGIKKHEEKKSLTQGIKQLGGEYVGGSIYLDSISHLIIPQVLSSEKFLAACAAGKWVVTPEYVLDSVKHGSWLAEEPYEVAFSSGSTETSNPVRQWREKVASGTILGAFQGWKVLLIIQEPTRRAMFNRVLKAGTAEVYDWPPSALASFSHVFAKPFTDESKDYNAPIYPVSHIVEHLFGPVHCVNIKLSPTELHSPENLVDTDLSNLEAEVKDYIIQREGRPRLFFFEFTGYYDPESPHSEAAEMDASDIACMIECGLFSEALDSIRDCVFPGVVPPAPHLISLLQYAQEGHATPAFLIKLFNILDNMLIINPPSVGPSLLKAYYGRVFQCPCCKAGSWPFLETAIRYCLSSEATCHPLPRPAPPSLLNFHYDIMKLFLKIFQREFHSVTAGDSGFPGSPVVTTPSGLLLQKTFWTVWERSTLLSSAAKKLTQLLIEAAIVDYGEEKEKRNLRVADTLLDIFSVLVEFWCQQNIKLNPSLVENGLIDLSEHFAMISQDLYPVVLAEVVLRIHSTRLKLMVADAIFRNVCQRNGITIGNEPLSYKKMVLSYLPLLGSLAQSPSGACLRTGPTPDSCTSQGNDCRTENSSEKDRSAEKESIPRGLNRVNTAGETLLHRACKRNQVETVLQILTLPGTDVNVEDHAGWTPLHEACNHGSTECVAILLRHRPAPVLNNQVSGVSPLHDALINGHMDIAKLLLEHAGSILLRQTDECGRVPLDLVSTPHEKDELLHSAQVGDAALRCDAAEVSNLPLLEAACTLLANVIFTYHREKDLPRDTPSLTHRLVVALQKQPSHALTLGWTDQRAVRLVEDLETLLKIGKGEHQLQVATCLRECKGDNTVFLMYILDDLKSRGERLAALT